MAKLIAHTVFVFGLVASSVAFAGERTITLAVKNMYCADCVSLSQIRSVRIDDAVRQAQVDIRCARRTE